MIYGSENHNCYQYNGNPEDHKAFRNSSKENESETIWNRFSNSNDLSDSKKKSI